MIEAAAYLSYAAGFAAFLSLFPGRTQRPAGIAMWALGGLVAVCLIGDILT